jgi:hypothetical protein
LYFRYIRGFLIRRKIRPLLAARVEKIVANNNPAEINDVRDELQVQTMTSRYLSNNDITMFAKQ